MIQPFAPPHISTSPLAWSLPHQVRLAVSRGRATRPTLTLGICGEHGGDPTSIDFFNRAGLDYVSCSPLRVPIARCGAMCGGPLDNSLV